MGLAALAAAAAFIYLNPAENDTWLSVALGVLVLTAPLGAKLPLSRHRLRTAALVWIALGLPGGYAFGTSVIYAGVLLGAALLVDAAIGRSGGRPRRALVTFSSGKPRVKFEMSGRGTSRFGRR